MTKKERNEYFDYKRLWYEVADLSARIVANERQRKALKKEKEELIREINSTMKKYGRDEK